MAPGQGPPRALGAPLPRSARRHGPGLAAPGTHPLEPGGGDHRDLQDPGPCLVRRRRTAVGSGDEGPSGNGGWTCMGHGSGLLCLQPPPWAPGALQGPRRLRDPPSGIRHGMHRDGGRPGRAGPPLDSGLPCGGSSRPGQVQRGHGRGPSAPAPSLAPGARACRSISREGASISPSSSRMSRGSIRRSGPDSPLGCGTGSSGCGSAAGNSAGTWRPFPVPSSMATHTRGT
jgi:hypothetical protein